MITMRDIPETFGDYPPVLYRCFKKEKYAKQFVEEGLLRFGILRYYKGIEDKLRQDKSEGHGSLHVPGDVTNIGIDKDGNVTNVWEEPGYIHLQSSSGNAIYIMSCVYPRPNDVSKIPKKFGNYIVRINDPIRLGHDITNKLWENAKDIRPVVECAEVIYNKGDKSTDGLDIKTKSKLSYAQKPNIFSDEHEYRLVIIEYKPASTEDEFLFVDLGGPITYAEILA